MRRALHWAGWMFAALLGIPLLLLGIVLVGANTDPGRHLIERLAARFTGDTVRIEGLSGRFPDALRIAHLELRDSAGAYATVDNAVLDWAPTRLLSGEALIDRLAAETVAVLRLPEPSPNRTASTSSSSNLPVRVVVNELHVGRLALAAPVAGHAADLTLDGSAALASLEQGQARLAAETLPQRASTGPSPSPATGETGENPAPPTPSAGSQPVAPGRYVVDAAIDPSRLRATVTVREAPDGLIAGIAALPGLGAIALDAALDGPRQAVATKLSLTAGELRAAADGTVDLTHNAADLHVTASAPAMSPRPDIAWRSVLLDARVQGPFDRPNATGTLDIASLTAAGASLAAIHADVAGDAGEVRVQTRLDGLRLPGPKPDLFAAAPVRADVTARLDQPDRPVTFAIRHPLLTAEGSARTAGAIEAKLALTVEELAPLAAVGGVDLQGRTALNLRATQAADTTTVALNGTLAITGGLPIAKALVGDSGKIDLAAALHGQDVRLDHLMVSGQGFDARANGSLANDRLAMNYALRLADLNAVQPTLSGQLEAQGQANGPLDDLAVTADLSGDVAAQGIKSGRFTAQVVAQHLPSAPQASVSAEGSLLDAPLSLALHGAMRPDGMTLSIERAAWKSLQANGDVALATGATLPTGTLRLSMQHLADLAPVLGRPIAGSVAASLDADTKEAKLVASVREAALPGTASINRMELNAVVSDPAGKPSVDGTLVLDGVAASGIRGSARLTARGPADALAVTASGNAAELAGGPAKLDLTGTLDAMGRSMALATMQASWKQETLRLLAPARIGFAQDITIDRLRFAFRQAEIAASGRVGSTLDVTASLRNLPADVAAIVAPDYAADGMINGEARLTGTSARPEGTVRVTANGVRLRSGPGQALPPANLTANTALNGTSARLDAQLTAGSSRLSVAGTAPLSATGPLDLRMTGVIDLAVADPILTAGGRRVRGRVTLDAGVAGTVADPRITGTARLANGEVQDFVLGVRITDMVATVQAEGDTIRIVQFTGRAGQGTVGLTGSVGVAGALPVNLRLTADNARLIASDILTAVIDANLTLSGEVKGDLAAGGLLHVRRADIRVPEKLPASVATIPTRVAGAPPPPPAKPVPMPNIALNVTLDAPSQIFIRGRGLDAELGGRVVLTGTAANPQASGGLQLRRGTFSLIGQTLTLTEGTIDFTGAGIANPSLKLVATSTTASIVATLTVSGSARDPKITLSSVPEVPQDEILAQLLFNTTTAKLGPFQLAQIGAALASLSGVGGGGDPLDKLRNALGLDRLSIGSSRTGTPTVEAGRYIARDVYLGARQSATGTGTQATVQVDIAKGLKLEATAGTATPSATGATSARDAASVGVTYQFEY